jgi:hypothetical protein
LYPSRWDRVRAYIGLRVFRLPIRFDKVRWYVRFFPYSFGVYQISEDNWDEENGPIPESTAWFEMKDPKNSCKVDLYITPKRSVNQIELNFVVKKCGVQVTGVK